MTQSLELVLLLGSILLCLKITDQAGPLPGNVAPRGRAAQSAGPASAATGPEMAIDSYKDPQHSGTTCASVPTQDDPWWRVDLMSIYHITAVSVFSEQHCCQEQLDGAEIRIGLRNDTNNHRCAIISAAEGHTEYGYQCGEVLGRFVYVVLPGQQRNLTVCEVQVYGTVLENVALRGVAYQSSSQWKTAGKASNAIDGVQFSTCCVTQNKPNQWVNVDLVVPYNISVIQLAFKEDCCYDVEVHVDITRCSGTSSSSQSLMTLDCGGIVGRTVTVFHPDVPLTLCEVEIFSTWNHPGNIFQQRPPASDCCSSDSCSCDYVFLGKEPMTWSQAQTYCRERYSDLAIVNNPKDMNTIVDNMDKNNLYSFWIGLHESELTWRWSAPEELYYNDTRAEFWNWAAGEPNNQMDIPHCVGMEDTGRWRDLDCSLLYCFICFDGQDGAPQAKVLVQTPMRWTDARQYCREEHTDLVAVRTSAENEELQSMVPSGTLVWIGLYGDAWKWSDGQDNLFRYWEKDQPKNSGNGPSCAFVGGGAWRTQPCDTKSSFLCYYYKKRTVVKISTDANLCDPVVKQHIQQQLEARMKNNGISNFKIHWKKSGRQLPPKGQISQCVNPEDGEV